MQVEAEERDAGSATSRQCSSDPANEQTINLPPGPTGLTMMTNQGLLSAPKCLLGETSIEEYRRAHPRSQRGWGNTHNRRSTLSPRAARTGKARKNNQRKDKGHVIGHSPQPEPVSHTRNHRSANNHTATRTTTLVPPETTFKVVLCRRKREPLSLDTEWHQKRLGNRPTMQRKKP